MRESVRIAHRRDAALIASIIDPAALSIKSPLQSHRAAACDALFIYSCFVPLCVPCYDLRDA